MPSKIAAATASPFLSYTVACLPVFPDATPRGDTAHRSDTAPHSSHGPELARSRDRKQFEAVNDPMKHSIEACLDALLPEHQSGSLPVSGV